MTTPFVDSFVEPTTTTNLESHTPSGGTAWTLAGGATGAAIVQATFDACRSRSTTLSYYICDDQGSANHYTQAVLATLSTLFPNSFVAARLVDSGNFVGWRCFGTGPSGIRLTERLGGTTTLDKVTFQGAAGKTYKVECSGSTATIYEDGVSKGSYTIDASLAGETSQGLVIGSDITIDWLSSFKAEALGGGATVALTGAAVTSSAGTITQSRANALAGTEVASAVGTLTGVVDTGVIQALTGSAAVASVGTVGVARTTSVSGELIESATGIVQAGSDVTAALSGSSVVVSTGALLGAADRGLVGIDIGSATGTISYSTVRGMTGLVANVHAGNVRVPTNTEFARYVAGVRVYQTIDTMRVYQTIDDVVASAKIPSIRVRL